VTAARTQDKAPVRRALLAHLGADAPGWPVVSASWPAYDHVNAQIGLDAWLAAPGRRHDVLGLTGFRGRQFGLADLTDGSQPDPLGSGSVTTDARPAGPGRSRSPAAAPGRRRGHPPRPPPPPPHPLAPSTPQHSHPGALI
jgi:hypothetical protein